MEINHSIKKSEPCVNSAVCFVNVSITPHPYSSGVVGIFVFWNLGLEL